MDKNQKFLLGADPELFVVNDKSEYISSIGKFGGSKHHPKFLLPGGFFIQEDNVAVEFNIPPAESSAMFVSNIEAALLEIEKRAKTLNLFLSITASASFSKEQLLSPKAREFGCEIDFNAWTGRPNKYPFSKDKSLRSCGGHLHFGWLDSFRNPIHVVRWLDIYLASPLSLVDKDRKRRELYGKAGSFRKKDYGLEYRTLSNYWISSPKLIAWVYNQCNKAIDCYDSDPENDLKDFRKPIEDHLNNFSNKAFELLASKFPIEYPPDDLG